jgi:tetratricopeptide (TPR) repeat protein
MSPPTPPKIFISYSHDSDEHGDRVLALADALRDDNIDAIIDQHHPNPPEGWPHWMEHHLDHADFVLLVCTETYYDRVVRRQPPGTGRGVQWEGTLVYNRLYNNPNLGHRFVPILLNGSSSDHIPEPLRGFTHYAISNFDISDKAYEALYRHLTGQPATPPKPLGSRKELPSSKRTGMSEAPSPVPPKSDRPWNVPHQRNPFFTGREDVLGHLETALATGKPAALTQAIAGLGGIGKTQTAVEYAYRHRDSYAAVLWAGAESDSALAGGFSEIARLLALPEAGAQDQSVTVAAVRRWLRENTGWLLILDNADDLGVVRRILPDGLPGHVLITTRANVLSGMADRITIARLEPEEGATFLLRRAGRIANDALLSAASDDDREAALALSKEMGGLPLALDQAGAYIEETPSTPRAYLALYKQRRADLHNRAGAVSATEHAPVAATFTLAFDKVEAAHPASAELLRLCAFLAPDAIPVEILTSGADHLGDILGPAVRDELSRNEAISWAYRWSLLEYDPAAGAFSLHRVAQSVIRDSLTSADRRVWAERAVLAVNAAFPYVEFSAWPLCEKLLPHVRVCAAHGVETVETARMFFWAAAYLWYVADYAAAVPLHQRALGIREKTLGPDHPDTAQSLNGLAIIYSMQGDYAAAVPLYQRSLAIRENALGPDHPDTATTINNLANLYHYQDDYATAEPLFQRALMIREKSLGVEHSDTAASLNNLAIHYALRGDYVTAEPLYKRSLAIREKVFGSEHPDTASSLNNLADLYYSEDNYIVAEPFYQRALAICETIHGPEHPDTTRCLSNYAVLLRETGRDVEAAELEARAAEGRKKHEEHNKQ